MKRSANQLARANRFGLLLVVSAVVLGPLYWAEHVAVADASSLEVQITPPPMEFPTPFGEADPTAPQFVEIGPISADNLPLTTRPELLTDPFGYAEILGQPGMYLVWSTDADGDKRYYVVDEENDYLDDIRSATDDFRELQREIEADPPAAKILIGTGGTVTFGLVSWGCALGAIVSAAAQLYPLAGVFIGCDAVTVPLTVGSAGYMWSGITQWNSFAMERDEAAEKVDGFFMQLPFTDQ